MIFGHDTYLCTPYRPLAGALSKNDAILDACMEHPDRFGVSPISGDPRVLVASLLTDPRNAAWEVWRGGAFVGIILLDRIVPNIDARWNFVFLDDELASKAGLLNVFADMCFAEFGLQRLSLEVPTHMTTMTSFAKRKLRLELEGIRSHAYFDGARWHDVTLLRRMASEV